jgi:hypothetical protein
MAPTMNATSPDFANRLRAEPRMSFFQARLQSIATGINRDSRLAMTRVMSASHLIRAHQLTSNPGRMIPR